MSSKVQKLMVPPISLIFRHLQQKNTVQIWLYDSAEIRMEGVIIGFDEFMNLVLDESVQVNVKTGMREELGRLLLKGDSIALIGRKQ